MVGAHDVDGLETALFCRGFGLILAAFAHFTLPGYLHAIENTVLVFPFEPWHHLPLGPLEPAAMERARLALLGSGCLLALGLLPRLALAVSMPLVMYFTQLDRVFYNNHYVLLAELCALLLVIDRRCLEWRPALALRPVAASRLPAPPTPRLPLWQLRSLQLLVLTPYTYGALAKLSPSWLVHAEPVRTWAEDMLGDADDALGGILSRLARQHFGDASLVLTPFAYATCYAGLVFDALVPIGLLRGSPRVRAACFASALFFHACNKVWFGLGIFPWLCCLALVLFVRPSPRVTPAATPATGADAADAGAPIGSGGGWARRLVVAVGILHAVLPLRGLAFGRYGARSSLWSDEGMLYSWAMKTAEKSGWLVLEVRDEGSADGRVWRLVPESDTALSTGQAGFLPYFPRMLLTYVEHLEAAFAARGVSPISVRAVGSCVRCNGYAAQPLYLPDADLVNYTRPYSSLAAEATGYSGIGRFLTPWQTGLSGDACDLTRPLGNWSGLAREQEVGEAADEDDASRSVLRASDAAYRWLYGPLLFGRPQKRDWPWRGRSRLPSVPTMPDKGGVGDGDDVLPPPAWATVCSFLHASFALWCPVDSQSHSAAGSG